MLRWQLRKFAEELEAQPLEENIQERRTSREITRRLLAELKHITAQAMATAQRATEGLKKPKGGDEPES